MTDKNEKIMNPCVDFLYGTTPKEEFGITWPKGTEVIIICRDEDKDNAMRDAELKGYKVSSVLGPEVGFPIRLGEYLMMTKPKPVVWKPREWEGEKIFRLREELKDKGIEL